MKHLLYHFPLLPWRRTSSRSWNRDEVLSRVIIVIARPAAPFIEMGLVLDLSDTRRHVQAIAVGAGFEEKIEKGHAARIGDLRLASVSCSLHLLTGPQTHGTMVE